jgi:hypothetical protein
MQRTKRLPTIAMLRRLRRDQTKALARLLAAKARPKAKVWAEMLRRRSK